MSFWHVFVSALIIIIIKKSQRPALAHSHLQKQGHWLQAGQMLPLVPVQSRAKAQSRRFGLTCGACMYVWICVCMYVVLLELRYPDWRGEGELWGEEVASPNTLRPQTSDNSAGAREVAARALMLVSWCSAAASQQASAPLRQLPSSWPGSLGSHAT